MIDWRFILLILTSIFLLPVFGINVAARAMKVNVNHFGSRNGRSHAFVTKGSLACGQCANMQITPISTHSTPLNLTIFKLRRFKNDPLDFTYIIIQFGAQMGIFHSSNSLMQKQKLIQPTWLSIREIMILTALISESESYRFIISESIAFERQSNWKNLPKLAHT